MPRSPHKLNCIAFVFLQTSRNKANYWSRPSFYNESFLELTCHIFPEVDIYEHKINLPRNTWSFSRYSHCLTIYVRSLCLPAGLLQVTDSELRMLVCSPPCECWHTIDTWLRRDRGPRVPRVPSPGLQPPPGARTPGTLSLSLTRPGLWSRGGRGKNFTVAYCLESMNC